MIDTEPFLAEALASLRTKLPAALAAVDVALGLSGGDALPLPRDDGGAIGSANVDYYLGVVAKPLRYPLVEVAVPDWSMTGFDIAQLEADAEFPLMAAATLRDASLSSDRLYRMLLRYTRALLNVLLVPQAFGQGATVTSVRGAYRQNPESRETEQVIGASLVALSISTTQNRE